MSCPKCGGIDWPDQTGLADRCTCGEGIRIRLTEAELILLALLTVVLWMSVCG